MRTRRYLKPLFVCGSIYFGTMALGCLLGHRFMLQRSEEVLSAAQNDIESSYSKAMDASLAKIASIAASNIGTAHPFSLERMRELCRLRGIDEASVVDSNGVFIASSESTVVGVRLDACPDTSVYFGLLTNGVPYVCQPFRRAVHDPSLLRKYVAVPFADRSGVLQFGYDVRRVEHDFETSYHTFLKDVSYGDSRFYFALSLDGRLLASGVPTTARDVCETGLVPTEFPTERGRTFAARVMGRDCWCRTSVFAGVRFVTMLPKSEFDDARFFWAVALHVVLLFVFAVLGAIYANDQRRNKAAACLRENEEKRRREDLSMAQSIQRSALPAVFPPYPRDLMIDLHAQMIPARDVGGDFYDFHYVGRDRLAVLVADVSGKGIPAAMFMMKAKAVLHDLMMSMTDLGEAVALANDILCEGNEADMFVTCWVGVLDETTGILRYVNAGHNPPYHLHAVDGSLQSLDSVSGMFLGGMSGLRYRTFETRMSPNDMLFLYTDGVTEANNTLGQMFGEERLEEVLRGERGLGLARFMGVKPSLPTPETLCGRGRGAVDGFAGKAAQFDDITMLALRYRGQPLVRRLTVPVVLESVARLNAFAEAQLNDANCPSEQRTNLLIALDEMSNNVASYSQGTEMTLEIEVARNPSVVRFRLIDDGTPWNPLDHLDPDISLSAEEREIGGLGILMVKKLMDDVSYVRRGDRNVFAFRKMI